MNAKAGATIPIVLAINICDEIIRDEISRKISLIGLFNRIDATSFPVSHRSMHVYVSLTDGHKIYEGELRFVNDKDESAIFTLKSRVPFKDPRQTVELNFEVRNLQFHEPGNYSVRFYCDGKLAGERRFIVNGPPRNSQSKGG
jgi:hypothetical protein